MRHSPHWRVTCPGSHPGREAWPGARHRPPCSTTLTKPRGRAPNRCPGRTAPPRARPTPWGCRACPPEWRVCCTARFLAVVSLYLCGYLPAHALRSGSRSHTLWRNWIFNVKKCRFSIYTVRKCRVGDERMAQFALHTTTVRGMAGVCVEMWWLTAGWRRFATVPSPGAL